jgi:hypothetical protein
MEGLALSVCKARRRAGCQCISVGFARRAFDLSRRADTTSSRDRENELLPTWTEAEKDLEPAQLLPWLRESPTQRGRTYRAAMRGDRRALRH